MNAAIHKSIIAHYAFLLSAANLCPAQEVAKDAEEMVASDIHMMGRDGAEECAALSMCGDATAVWCITDEFGPTCILARQRLGWERNGSAGCAAEVSFSEVL